MRFGFATAPITDANWTSLAILPGASDYVYATAVDAGANLYIAGRFRAVGNTVASGVARWNGTNWIALGSGILGDAYALAINGNDLYVGGEFETVGAVSGRYNIAKWTIGATNNNGWSSIGSGVDSRITALAVIGNTLYAGGWFTVAGGVAGRNHIAKWSIGSSDDSGWSAVGSGLDQEVDTLANLGSGLYVGGKFTTAGGNPANRIAKWDGTAWSTLASGLGGDVYALALSGTDLYVGGAFTTAGGITANRIAKWDGSSWSALGSGLSSEAYALASDSSGLYVGGFFSQAGGRSRSHIARWALGGTNNNSWSSLSFQGFDNSVFTLAVISNNLYSGGAFLTANGNTSPHIARWDGTNWSTMGFGLGGNIGSMAVAGGNFYFGGNFTFIGTNSIKYLAKWNGTTWSPLGSGVNGPVSELAIAGNDLYVAGTFTTAGTNAANRIAKWILGGTDDSSWSALGSGVWDGAVSAIVVKDNYLYIGGSFGTVAGISPRSRVARWTIGGTDDNSWSGLGSGFGLNLDVYALAVKDDYLYVGGIFTEAGFNPCSRIAKWKIGGTNDNSWSAVGKGMDGTVYTLATWGTNLYAGGAFLRASNSIVDFVMVNGIAKWDGNAWSALGTNGNYANYLLSLCPVGSDLYVGGEFLFGSAPEAMGIAKWDGSTWSALGSGVNSTVNFLGNSGSDLYVGGSFSIAGGKASAGFARVSLISPASALPGPFINSGNFVVQYDGTPGATYTVEYTDKLSPPSWQKATNTTAPDADQGLGRGVFEFRSSAATPTRFYRTVYPPY